MGDLCDDKETELDVLDEAVADIAVTRLEYFQKCKKLIEKSSNLQESHMINRRSECYNQTVEAINVPEVKLANLSHFSAQNLEKSKDLSTKVMELNKILEMKRRAKENSVRCIVGSESSLLNPNEGDAGTSK